MKILDVILTRVIVLTIFAGGWVVLGFVARACVELFLFGWRIL